MNQGQPAVVDLPAAFQQNIIGLVNGIRHIVEQQQQGLQGDHQEDLQERQEHLQDRQGDLQNRQEDIEDRIEGIVQQQEALQEVLAEIGDKLNDIQTNGPLQAFNALRLEKDALQYPDGVVREPLLPLTKEELRCLSAAGCIASMEILGLTALPAGTHLSQRRQVLWEYLGCGVGM